MPRKHSYLTVTDQFCGAGGSSLGAAALGLTIVLALNHWQLAIQTHNSNFPNTIHDCTDISACDPRRYPSTDILITSPECTNHSLAKGKKRKGQGQPELWQPADIDPSEERSRATMWDVPRFAEFHDYNLIVVENVVDARHWRLFDAWLKAMADLDYRHEIVYFNSQFAWPTPQSRDRMYVVFWKRGNPAPDLNFYPRAYCMVCEQDVDSVQSWKNPHKKWGRYGKTNGQYVYRCPKCASLVDPYYYAAYNAIDWQLPISRISERKRPLREKTVRRIQIGLERFSSQRFPFLVELGHASSPSGYVRPATEPWPTQTTAQSLGLVTPFIIGMDRSDAVNNRAYPVTRTWPTLTTQKDKALVIPPPLPYIIELYGTSTASPITDPLSTVVAGGNHHGLVVTEEAMRSFLVSYYGQDVMHGVTEAMGTLTTIARHALVTPVGEGAALPSIEDCYFRMLQPSEIGRAMAFPESYIVLGDSRAQTKLYGNAVTPPVMKKILDRCVPTLC